MALEAFCFCPSNYIGYIPKTPLEAIVRHSVSTQCLQGFYNFLSSVKLNLSSSKIVLNYSHFLKMP